MSTGPRKKAAFIQGNQSAIEHDASHSALFYLFQEVSKLASPVHNSFMDTDVMYETSRQAPLIVKKEEEDERLFRISNGSCQYSLSPCKQMKKVKEESHSSKVTTMVEPHLNKSNSPWKVLSLINRQCERLLHQEDVAAEPSLLSSTTKLGHSINKSSTTTADVMDQGVNGDSVSVECTLRPSLLICERQEIPAGHSVVEGVRGDCRARSYKPQCRVKDSKVGCCVQSQAAGNVSLLNVDRQCQCNQECKRTSSEQGILHAPFSERFFPQTHIHYAFLDAQLTFNSKEDANVALSNPSAMDHNANLTLTAEPPCDTTLPHPNPVPPPQSAPLLFGTTQECQSLAKRDEPECTYDCTNLSPSAASKPKQRPPQQEESASPSPQRWRSKTPRKQPHPRRSADIQDPDFQGVTFRMDTELDDNREQCRLLITSNYSKELRKSVRKPRLRKRTSQNSSKTSSSDEDLTASVSKGKVCASCCTRKTPMWRDAEDGTPLCNACGIRYKKYRVRCVKCWHIPRKEGNSNSCCLKCGNFVSLTSAQRKHNA